MGLSKARPLRYIIRRSGNRQEEENQVEFDLDFMGLAFALRIVQYM